MASDMVRLKMDNDTLADDNEGLKFQVVELQKMIDTQPAEVEEKLKAEMDRIMQRNIEVQNENRALKEEMDEMERELVNAKMSHAEVSNHPPTRILCFFTDMIATDTLRPRLFKAAPGKRAGYAEQQQIVGGRLIRQRNC